MTRIGKFYHFFTPWNTTWHCLYPINPKARAMTADIMNKVYYSFIQIPLRFWLHKIPRTISWPNLKQVCNMWKMTSKKTGQLTEKTWGRGWFALVASTKWRNISLVSRGGNRHGEGAGLYTGYKVYSKKIKNTTTRTTSAIWRIFVEPI